MNNKLYACFANDGEVPLNAFKLLGASSKRDQEGKIGFYGTGLKYAIVVLQRVGVPFRIFSGTKEVIISQRSTQFLDRKVSVLTVNGEKTSITLEAGIDWEPWFAVREIYSNTVDELGIMSMTDAVAPEAEKTKIYIDTNHELMAPVFDFWGQYFSNSRHALFTHDDQQILSKMEDTKEWVVFRRGIRAHYGEKTQSLFDYNVTDVAINESRVIKYVYQAKKECGRLLSRASEDVVQRFIDAVDTGKAHDCVEYESEFWEYVSAHSFSAAWPKMLEGRKLVPHEVSGFYDITKKCIILPAKLVKLLKACYGSMIETVDDPDGKYVLTDRPEGADARIAAVLGVLKANGLDYDAKDVDVVKFSDKQQKGMSKDNKIYISLDLFTPTYEHLLGPVILEEIVHDHTGFGDKTRSLQDYLFRLSMNLMTKVAESGDNPSGN